MNFFPSCLTIHHKTETYVLMLMYEWNIPPQKEKDALGSMKVQLSRYL